MKTISKSVLVHLTFNWPTFLGCPRVLMHCALDSSTRLVLAYFTEKLRFSIENDMSEDNFDNNEEDTKIYDGF